MAYNADYSETNKDRERHHGCDTANYLHRPDAGRCRGVLRLTSSHSSSKRGTWPRFFISDTPSWLHGVCP